MHEDTHAGRVLDGRYRVGPRIARGGMASVHEAHDLRLDRTVAVKIMHTGLGDGTSGDDDFAARFVREARAAARLSHPHVVAVYDQGEDDGTVFLAMELVSGHTLRDTITKEAPMSPQRALALLDPVVSALASAHRNGLIHRDVKPENVLIADDGRVKVADFGLARAVSADTQHTATQGVLIGTVSYLAPELVVDGRADARADVYAVGVILFELLTGTKPHTGESPIQVAYRHVHEDVPAPSTVVPGIPEYVDALVARATTRDPSLRPADAGVLLHHAHRVAHALRDGVTEDADLVEDLRPAPVRGDTTPDPISTLRPPPAAQPAQPAQPAPPPPTAAAPVHEHTSRFEPAPPRRRRRRGVVLLLVAVLLAGAVGGGAYWFGWARYTTTPTVVGLTQAEAEEELADAGLDVADVVEVYSESVGAGEVVATDPGPGARILPDGDVALTVSKGPERYDVPDLSGVTVEEAGDRLEDVRLVAGRTVERWSENVPEGRVIRSRPRFGTKKAKNLPVDSTVDLVVSKGRRPRKVGSWVGQDFQDAKATLERRGLTVKVTDRVYDDDVAEGDVISHEPTGGTLFKNDTVEFVVSRGPELVEIPRVFYESTDDAVATLEELGFEVKIEHAAVYFTGERAYSTDPGPGSKARKGSTVVLFVV